MNRNLLHLHTLSLTFTQQSATQDEEKHCHVDIFLSSLNHFSVLYEYYFTNFCLLSTTNEYPNSKEEASTMRRIKRS